MKYNVSEGTFRLRSKPVRLGLVVSAVNVLTAITPGLRMLPLMSATLVDESILRNVVVLETASKIMLLIAVTSPEANEIEIVLSAIEETLTLVNATASVGLEAAF